MKKIILFITLFCLGCTDFSSRSIPSLEADYLALGKNKDVLLSRRGIPTNIYKKENEEVWEYYEGSNTYFDGYHFKYDWGGISSTYHKKTIYFIENDIIVGFKS